MSAPPDPQFYTLGEFLDADIEKPANLIDGVLAGGSSMILGAPHKTGKTWLLGQMAMAVASGKPWLWWSTVQAPVVVLNYEVASWAFQERLKAQEMGFLAECDGDRKTRQDIRNNLSVISLPRWKLNSRRDLIQIAAEVGGRDAGLVILDPIRGAFNGEPNDDRAVNAVMNDLLAWMIQPTGAAVVLAHHFRKPKAGESLDAGTFNVKGSGAWSDAADGIVTLLQRKASLNYSLNLTLRHFESVDDATIRFLPSKRIFVTGEASPRQTNQRLRDAFRQSLAGELTMKQIGEALSIDRSRAHHRWMAGEWPQIRESRSGERNQKFYTWESGS